MIFPTKWLTRKLEAIFLLNGVFLLLKKWEGNFLIAGFAVCIVDVQ